METKFTKGPWVLDQSSEMSSVSASGAYGEYIGITYMTLQNHEANAHLIAAAPTMADYVKRKADDGCEEAASIWEQINAR